MWCYEQNKRDIILPINIASLKHSLYRLVYISERWEREKKTEFTKFDCSHRYVRTVSLNVQHCIHLSRIFCNFLRMRYERGITRYESNKERKGFCCWTVICDGSFIYINEKKSILWNCVRVYVCMCVCVYMYVCVEVLSLLCILLHNIT